MKKTVSLLLAALMCLALIGAAFASGEPAEPVSAGEPAEPPAGDPEEEAVLLDGETAEGTCGDGLSWRLSQDGILVITGSGAMDDFGKDGAPWYDVRNSVKVISFPDGLTHIGAYAFYKCANLMEAVIPTSVTGLGEFSFSYCSALKTVHIPKSVTAIGAYTFTGSTALETVEYTGSRDDWNGIDLGLTGNKYLFDALVYDAEPVPTPVPTPIPTPEPTPVPTPLPSNRDPSFAASFLLSGAADKAYRILQLAVGLD